MYSESTLNCVRLGKRRIYSGFHIDGALAELMGIDGQWTEFQDHPSAKIAGTYLFFFETTATDQKATTNQKLIRLTG